MRHKAPSPHRRWPRVLAWTLAMALGGTSAASLAQPASPAASDGLFGLSEPAAGAAALSETDQIREVLALYGRAVDTRNLEAFRKIFTPDVFAENFLRQADGTIWKSKRPATHSVAEMVDGLAKLAPLSSGEKHHHFTHDHIIEIHGDTAHMNAQFLVTASRTAISPVGPQGTVQTELTGYYDDVLKKIDGRWLIAEHRVIVDFPLALPK